MLDITEEKVWLMSCSKCVACLPREAPNCFKGGSVKKIIFILIIISYQRDHI